MEGEPSAEQTRRAAAEARRQKILARQKDRLSSITGTYSQQPEDILPERPQVAAQQPPAIAAGDFGENTATTTAQEQPSRDEQQQQQERQQQLAALMASVGESLQRAQAASRAVEGGSQPQPGPDTIRSSDDPQQLLNALLPGLQQQPQAQPQQQSQGVPLLLKLGSTLSAAVERTQLVRLLSSALLAYAALSGWLTTPLPPTLTVLATSLAIIAAAALLLHTSGQPLHTSGQPLQQQRVEPQLPRSMRSFDMLSLVPGLRELLQALGGYYQLFNGLSTDLAAYLVALGLLVATGAVPAQSWAEEQ